MRVVFASVNATNCVEGEPTKMPRLRTAHKISERKRTTDVMSNEQVDFSSLLLSPLVLKGLNAAGFEQPSPIQLKAIPIGRCGVDVIAQAKSGTGKTCVFSVIALESITLSSPSTQVVVLAPTREIAVQIKEVICAIGCHMKGLACHVFIGGISLDIDKQRLRKCQIAVGTPGRMKHLIENKLLVTDHVRLFILDEADKLLDETFQQQINWIFSSLPTNKQVLALSATYPDELAAHLKHYMRNPTFLRLNADNPALQGVRQFIKTVSYHQLPLKVFDNKVGQLLELLSSLSFHQCLVFSNYQFRAQSLCETLCSSGWPATYISGSQDQTQRLKVMQKLKEFECRVLVTTDLTSRGIDAERVNLVVNMDIPRDGETYLHRIGRAGRFGTHAIAVTLVAMGEEESKMKAIQFEHGLKIDPLPDDVQSLDSFFGAGFKEREDLIGKDSEEYEHSKDSEQQQISNDKMQGGKLENNQQSKNTSREDQSNGSEEKQQTNNNEDERELKDFENIDDGKELIQTNNLDEKQINDSREKSRDIENIHDYSKEQTHINNLVEKQETKNTMEKPRDSENIHDSKELAQTNGLVEIQQINEIEENKQDFENSCDGKETTQANGFEEHQHIRTDVKEWNNREEDKEENVNNNKHTEESGQNSDNHKDPGRNEEQQQNIPEENQQTQQSDENKLLKDSSEYQQLRHSTEKSNDVADNVDQEQVNKSLKPSSSAMESNLSHYKIISGETLLTDSKISHVPLDEKLACIPQPEVGDSVMFEKDETLEKLSDINHNNETSELLRKVGNLVIQNSTAGEKVCEDDSKEAVFDSGDVLKDTAHNCSEVKEGRVVLFRRAQAQNTDSDLDPVRVLPSMAVVGYVDSESDEENDSPVSSRTGSYVDSQSETSDTESDSKNNRELDILDTVHSNASEKPSEEDNYKWDMSKLVDEDIAPLSYTRTNDRDFSNCVQSKEVLVHQTEDHISPEEFDEDINLYLAQFPSVWQPEVYEDEDQLRMAGNSQAWKDEVSVHETRGYGCECGDAEDGQTHPGTQQSRDWTHGASYWHNPPGDHAWGCCTHLNKESSFVPADRWSSLWLKAYTEQVHFINWHTRVSLGYRN